MLSTDKAQVRAAERKPRGVEAHVHSGEPSRPPRASAVRPARPIGDEPKRNDRLSTCARTDRWWESHRHGHTSPSAVRCWVFVRYRRAVTPILRDEARSR